MAKIRGIELKSVTKFKGHEGEPLTQGNIYMYGKKIGSYSDDSWGGPIHLDIEKQYEAEFYRIAEEYLDDDDKFMAEDIFIEDLVNLRELEQDFKKLIKKGYKALVIVEHPRRYPQHVMITYTDINKVIKWLDENGMEDYKVDGEYQLKMYSDLSQFEIN